MKGVHPLQLSVLAANSRNGTFLLPHHHHHHALLCCAASYAQLYPSFWPAQLALCNGSCNGAPCMHGFVAYRCTEPWLLPISVISTTLPLTAGVTFDMSNTNETYYPWKVEQNGGSFTT